MESVNSTFLNCSAVFKLVGSVLFAFVFGQSVYAQNFHAWGGNIPNNTVNNLYSQTISGVGNLTGSNQLVRVCLSIDQPIPNDIDVFLISPAGTSVMLSSDNGGSSGNDYRNGLCFSDCGPSGTIVGANNFQGVYLPEASLSAFNNGQNADGTWQLRVDDDAAAGGNGILNYWSLDFGTPTMPTNPTGRNCATAYVLTSLPYSHTCMTLAGSGNDYTNGACNTHIDGSEYVFAYTPTTTEEFLSIDAAQDFSAPSGFPTISLLDTCPNLAQPINCIASEIQFSSTENILHITSQPLTVGKTYYIVVASTSGTGGNYDIRIAMGRNGSTNCVTATNITNTGEYAGNNYNAPAPNPLAPSTLEMSCNGSIDNFIFYTFTTDASGNDVHASITDVACNLSCGGACGVQVALFQAPVGGACLGPGTWGPAVFCGTSTLNNAYYNWLGLLPNTQYFLMVDGTAGSQCVWNLRVLGGVQQTPLPANFLAFSAAQAGENNLIEWEIAQELNVDRYEVQHASNALDFVAVGSVAAKGALAQSADYSLRDGNVEPGWHYYRIKIIDNDGSSSYTNVVKLFITAEDDYFALYPNPATEHLELRMMAAGPRSLRILSTDGRLCQQLQVEPTGELESYHLQIDQLPSGLYFVEISAASGKSKVLKFVKL